MEMLKNKLIELVRLYEGQSDETGRVGKNYESNRLSRLSIELELKELFGCGQSQIKKMQKFLITQGELNPNEEYRKYILNIK